VAAFKSWRRMRAARGYREPAAGGAVCRYVAIVMDGNGRWAQRKGLPVAAGHRAGARALRRVLERCLDVGIEEVTVYSFSTENWNRPAEEVAALMDLFIEQITTQVPEIHERGVRVRFVGRREGVPPLLVERIDAAESLTALNTRMTLYIAFNYGGRAEILDAARALAARAPAALAAGASPDSIDEAAFRRCLSAPEMHDPELLIRTSGEQRISNFLLWQLAYSELYFSPKLWPDFGESDLDEALAEYARRLRRFGAR
jgi:undecaprenyl diphosphate synthase